MFVRRLLSLVCVVAAAAGLVGGEEAPPAISVRAATVDARALTPFGGSGRAITPFAITPAANTFTWNFTAAREGVHTASANWTSVPAVQLALSVSGGDLRGPELTNGPAPQQVPFLATPGQTYVVTVSLRAATGPDIAGQLAVLNGRGQNLGKRPLHAVQPMSAEALAQAGTPGMKDPILPLIAALAERRLAGASNRNEFDANFDKLLARHPAVTDAVLQRFVTAFRAMPQAEAAPRFMGLNRRGAALAQVTRAEVQANFRGAQRALATARAAANDDALLFVPPAEGAVVAGPVETPVLPPPHIDNLAPKAPLLGYSRGATFTIVGSVFHPEAALNKVEMRAAEPQKIGNKSFLLAGKGTSGTELTVTLPLTMPSAKWFISVSVGGKKSNEVSFWTTNTAVPGAIPGPVISGFDPPGQEPSQQILINGANFQPGLLHRVLFTNFDLPSGPSYHADAKVLSATQLQVTIPELAIPGKHTVQALIFGWPYSDAKIYDIAAPRYRVAFLKMICDDESDPEWCGDDELVTFWTAAADAQVWAKNTDEYTGFEDGTTKSYQSNHSIIVPATGEQWAEVKWALAVNAQLYEWDAGDIKATQEFVGFVGEYGSYAASMAWGPVAGEATKIIAALLAEAIGRFAKWLGGDPDSLGKRQFAYTGAELQAMLVPGGSVNGTFNYHNSDDEGGYRLTYKIFRE